MSERANPSLPSRSRAFARGLRQTQTDAEAKLWQRLRSSRLAGLKFRRQRPVPPYVLDFYCESAKIGVELDGSQHSIVGDAVRTAFLDGQGIRLLRFWDSDVLGDLEAVLAAILASIDGTTLTPTPLPVGEGLQHNADR